LPDAALRRKFGAIGLTCASSSSIHEASMLLPASPMLAIWYPATSWLTTHHNLGLASLVRDAPLLSQDVARISAPSALSRMRKSFIM
jgi:hypothetical protein